MARECRDTARAGESLALRAWARAFEGIARKADRNVRGVDKRVRYLSNILNLQE